MGKFSDVPFFPITIHDNIPLPPRRRGRQPGDKNKLETLTRRIESRFMGISAMEVGMSFIIPAEYQEKISAMVQGWANKVGKKFTCRRNPEDPNTYLMHRIV